MTRQQNLVTPLSAHNIKKENKITTTIIQAITIAT
jgi:hypothetical protein